MDGFDDDADFGLAVTEVGGVADEQSSVGMSDTDSLLPGFSRRVAISRDFPNLRASCCVIIFFFRCLDASAAYNGKSFTIRISLKEKKEFQSNL